MILIFLFLLNCFTFFPHFFLNPFLFFFIFFMGVALLSFFYFTEWKEEGRKKAKPLTRDRSTSVPNNAVIDGEGGRVAWLVGYRMIPHKMVQELITTN